MSELTPNTAGASSGADAAPASLALGLGPAAGAEAQEEESLLAQLRGHLQILFRRKLLVIFLTAAGGAAGYLWLREQAPRYRATARVMIDRRAPQILANTNDVVRLGSPTDYRGQLMYFQTQYEIIRSRPVMERVLDRLGLWNSEHLLKVDDRHDELDAPTRRKLLTDADMPSVLADRLEVKAVENSMLVNIRMEDTDPAFAMRVVNAVARAYEDENLDHKRKAVTEALGDLDELEKKWAKSYHDAQDRTRAYEVEHNVGTIPNSKKAIDERVATLSARLTEARLKVLQLQKRSASLAAYRDNPDINHIAAADILQDGVIRNMRRKVSDLRAKLAALRTRYLDKHPDVVALQTELRSLTRSLRLEIQGLAESVRREHQQWVRYEAGVKAELERARAEETALADVERQYERLVTTETQYKKQYDEINQRHIQTRASAQVETNNVRLMDPAVQAPEVWPRRGVVLFGAAAGGFLLALLRAYLLEYGDTRIRGWAEIEERMGQKVLGVVPVIAHGSGEDDAEPATAGGANARPKFGHELYIADHPTSRVAEAFRALRTNLLFMGTTKQLKSLLITSAEPSEGKTTVALSTALSMASSGARVLLVEADMRRPRLGKACGLPNDKGFTRLLVGDGELSSQVQETANGLHVLLCGPIPPNPAELLHTPRFHELFEAMREEYDTVIFDSPPTGPVADAMVLAGQVDGCLLVVRAGRTSRHALRHAFTQLQSVGGHMLGVVLNYREEPRAGYRYGYGYGYGYGYRYGHRYGYSSAYTADSDGA